MMGIVLSPCGAFRAIARGLLLAIFLFSSAAQLAAQPSEEWAARYDGGNDPPLDEGKIVAVDPFGDFVVVATSKGLGTGTDWLTIKYDKYSREIWSSRHDGPASGDDVPSAVAFQPDGNVIVAGTCAVAGRGKEITVICYYGYFGGVRWIQRHASRFADKDDSVNSIATDSQGNLFVAGMSWGGTAPVPPFGCPPLSRCPPDMDYLVARYDSYGAEVLVEERDGGSLFDEGPYNDSAYRIAMDPSGNAYVYGGIKGNRVFLKYPTAGNDVALEAPGFTCRNIETDSAGNIYLLGDQNAARYGANGAKLWEKQLSVTSLKDFAVDGAGNLFLAGSGTVPERPGDLDFVTFKLDPGGNQLWTARYNYGRGDAPGAIALDSGGNVLVAGESSGDDGKNVAAVKYGPGGNELLVKRLTLPFQVNAFAFDALPSLITTGVAIIYRDQLPTILECATARSFITMEGDYLWLRKYSSPLRDDVPVALAVDPERNVYVTGTSYAPGSKKDFVTVKYDRQGNRLWTARYDGPANGTDEAAAMAIDPAGNAVVVGTSEGAPENYDFAVVKYDAGGNQLWAARYNGQNNPMDVAKAVAIGSNGRVYVTGTSFGDYLTVAFDESGAKLWAFSYDHAKNQDTATAIAVDSQGNCYVTGTCSDIMTTGEDCVTVKYDPSGNRLWATAYKGPGAATDRAADIALDSAGNAVITGYTSDALGVSKFLTAKYSPAGAEQWAVLYAGTLGNINYAFDLAVDQEKNVYVAGFSFSSGQGQDYALVKYDSGGSQKWAARLRGYSSPVVADTTPACIALGPEGKVFVSYGNITQQTGPDFAIDGYDPDGNRIWTAGYSGPGSGSDFPCAIAADSRGNVYVAGRSFGLGTGTDYALVKYSSGPEEVAFRRGDANGDGRFDISDATTTLGHLFLGEPAVLGCRKSADADDSGKLDISDAVGILGYLFLGTAAPRPPFPDCGRDSSADALDCESFPVCP